MIQQYSSITSIATLKGKKVTVKKAPELEALIKSTTPWQDDNIVEVDKKLWRVSSIGFTHLDLDLITMYLEPVKQAE